MSTRRCAVSAVLPAYNEADNIEQCVRAAAGVLSELVDRWEIIVVDDGSVDDTAAVVRALSTDLPGVRLVQHAVNQGYGAALRSGFRAARLELVFFTDSDLQFDLSELALVLPHVGRCDIVAGYRANRRDPWNRRANAWAWGQLVNEAFDLQIQDVNCAFKLFHRRVLSDMSIQSDGAFVNTEVLARARAEGCSIVQVPVTHFPRPAGVQTGASPRVVARAFVELVSLYGDLRGARQRARVKQVASAVLARVVV